MTQDRLTPQERETVARLSRTPLNRFGREDCFALMEIVNRLAPPPEPGGSTGKDGGR